MNSIPAWSTSYKVRCLSNNDLIVLGQKNHYFLPVDKFPLFHLIDGRKSESDILDNARSPEQISFFLYQLEQLKQVTDILQRDTANSDTLCISELVVLDKIKSELKSSDITLVFVSSFFDDAIEQYLTHHNGAFIFLSVLDEKLAFSPMFTSDDVKIATAFRQRLLQNKPIIGLLNNLFPTENNLPPITTGLIKSFCSFAGDDLIKKITHELKTKAKQVLLVSAEGKLERHPCQLMPSISSNDYKEQLNTPIFLDTCLAHFNQDGGSRHIAPSETIELIKPYISSLTGIITNLKELDTSTDYPVRIYSTAFFKPVPVKDIDKISSDSFVQTCLGKGVTHDQSKASGLCEAIERYSAQFQGNEPLFLAKSSELDLRHLSFQQLAPYSQQQYDNFSNSEHPDSRIKQATVEYQDEEINWLKAWSLSKNEAVYVPLTCCFANIPFEDDKFGRWHSNGAAAGNTLEEAILQGIFELIERDATAIWWYNKLEYPSFDLTHLDSKYYEPLHKSLTDRYDYWVLDLTIDTGVPVMAAIGKHRESNGFVFGFGCHLMPELAAQRALTELCQLIPIRDQNGAPFDFDAIPDESYLYPLDKTLDTQYLSSNGLNIKEDIENIISHVKNLGLEIIALNYSRGLPVKTAKIFIPGLCHIWPQLANDRLYKNPSNINNPEPKRHTTLKNSIGLYI